MRPALRDLYRIADDSVHQSVDPVDSPAPVSMPVMLQRLGFADAAMPVPVYVKQELVDPPERLSVLILPV